MKNNFRILLVVAFLIECCRSASGSSIVPVSPDEHFRQADAVCRGTVLGLESYQDTNGLIFTRTSVRVDEVFKGRFPGVVSLTHRGGDVGGIGMRDGLSPQFKPGEERLLFLSRRRDGRLSAMLGDASAVRLKRQNDGFFIRSHRDLLDGVRRRAAVGAGADVTDQGTPAPPDGWGGAPSGDNGGASTNGLLVDNLGVPWRYPAPDRGEPVPYLVDTNFLPAGISPAQALTAVSNAFAAWAAACSFRFVFIGTQNFGQAAANISTNDGIIRVQVHDNYNYISSANVLGVGGSYFSVGLLTNASWGSGGNASGVEFDKASCGFVVLKHTNSVMTSLSTFTEVLTHEVGHVLGLAHSSNVTTNDPALTDSIMYYLAHADGRGAKLANYDTNVVRELHPFNTPPYTYPRVMDITTTPSGDPGVAGVNEVELRGYDLQTTNVTLAVTNASSSAVGSFSLAGQRLKFTATGYYQDNRLDPAGNSYYDKAYARFSDGTNASPYVLIRTISHNADSIPPSDGIPDGWMNAFFGHNDPQAGDKSQASDDADGDGLNNLQEFISGSDPKSAASAQKILLLDKAGGSLQWQAKAYALYEVLGSTNLVDWKRVGNPVVPTNASLFIRTNLPSALITATVSNLPTGGPRMYYRIQKVP